MFSLHSGKTASALLCLFATTLLPSFAHSGEIKIQGKLHRLTPCKDDKYYEVKPMGLRGGVRYRIDLTSMDFDTYLLLLDSSGKLLRKNDDASAQTVNSRIFFTAPKNDVYQIVITSYEKRAMGKYVVKILSTK